MSLQRRFAFGAAGLVALAVGIGLVAAWFVVRTELRNETDSSLRARAAAFTRIEPPPSLPRRVPRPRLASFQTYAQLVTSAGTVSRLPGQRVALPTAGAAAVAVGRRSAFFRDATIDGIHVRLYVAQARPGTAVEIARPMTEDDHLLNRLKLLFAGVSLLALAAGVCLAFAFTRRVLRPVRALTQHAERLAETGDLTQRADVSRSDELGRLARAVNTMLDALARSVGLQRQLVADASHELRTPLAVARTNIDILRRHEELPPEQRAEILQEALAELEEMTTLIDELVELARGDIASITLEPTRLDAVVEDVAEVAVRRSGRDVRLHSTPSLVAGSGDALARAVANLIDNAVKWGPPGAPIDVTTSDGVVTVRDYGPGVDAGDLPHIFDRFYRASAARTMPGSGLGLAIVRQVAEAHGGTVSARQAPGGGAIFTLAIPTLAAVDGR